MREPRFRAWDTSLGRMFYTDGATISEIVQQSSECADGFWFEDEDIWMEYTGKKDRLGVPIFEDDLCKLYTPGRHGNLNPMPSIYQVKLMDHRATLPQWEFRRVGSERYYASTAVMYSEVVGNTRENPELLEEKK